VPVSTLLTLLHELEVKGTIGYSPAEFDQTIELMAKKIIKTERFISKTVGLDEVQEAFEQLTSGETTDVKIVIQP